jgi:hypothetical protein
MNCPVCNSARFKNGRCAKCRYINDMTRMLEDFYTFDYSNDYQDSTLDTKQKGT